MENALENCYVCGEYMGPFKNDLSVRTGFSEREVYKIFESFTKQKIPDNIVEEAGICQNCFIRFNDFDEYSTRAAGVQRELMFLHEASLSVSIDSKPLKIKVEIEDELNIVGVFEDPDAEGFSEDEICDRLQDEFPETTKKRTYTRRKDLDEGLIVVIVDGVKTYQCEICKKLCRDRYKLRTHREIHKSERTVCCNECGAMFKTLTCLYSHKKIHRERIYYHCDHCEMRYIQKTQLRKHMEAIHLKRRDHVCSICGKCYSRDTTLSKHMFVHKEEKDVVCTVCGFRTHTKPKMERHMKSHTGERNYECHLCGKRFLYSYNVTAHVKHVHNREKRKIDEEKLTCKFCGKRFQKIWKVKEHMTQVHQLVEKQEEDDRKYEMDNFGFNLVRKNEIDEPFSLNLRMMSEPGH